MNKLINDTSLVGFTLHVINVGSVVMCILFFDFQPFPQSGAYKLILASNRDEFYDRPTDTVRFWDDNPNICAGNSTAGRYLNYFEILTQYVSCAGRDRLPLRGDGTWLGISRTGRIATLTNVRVRNDDYIPNATGRGYLRILVLTPALHTYSIVYYSCKPDILSLGWRLR